jgi:hypothetical protein
VSPEESGRLNQSGPAPHSVSCGRLPGLVGVRVEAIGEARAADALARAGLAALVGGAALVGVAGPARQRAGGGGAVAGLGQLAVAAAPAAGGPGAGAGRDVADEPRAAVPVLRALHASPGDAGHERAASLRRRLGGATLLADGGDRVTDLSRGAGRAGEAAQVLLADEGARVAALARVAVAPCAADARRAGLAAHRARLRGIEAEALHAVRAQLAVRVRRALVAEAGAQGAEALDRIAQLGQAALARAGAAGALALDAELPAGEAPGAIGALQALWRGDLGLAVAAAE